MDGVNRGNAAVDLFSRPSSTPPVSDNIGNLYSTQNPSAAQLSALFSNPNESGTFEDAGRAQTPLMPGSLHDDSAVAASSSNADRQSALLSLLSGNPNARPPNQSGTPPTAASLPNVGGSPSSHNEAQGKLLLEQLMAGNPTSASARSNYSEAHDVTSSPPYAASMHEAPTEYHRPTHSHEASFDLGPYPTQGALQQGQSQASQDKSIFDFVSPFDALNASPAGSAASGSGVTKPKSIPQPVQQSEMSYSAPDPRRASVDNLLESLTRGAVPAPQPSTPPQQHASQSYDSYQPHQPEYGSPSQANIFPPKSIPSPARASPQKQGRTTEGVGRGRNADSPASSLQQPSRREREGGGKDGSPVPVQASGRGSIRGKKNKHNHTRSPAPQPQNIIFDVAQQQSGIQAPSDFVKSTAIALVRQDSVFLPGTTIGATSWVAYAMTRGRVRVISRSSGDRTLLQLPPVFPQTSTVVDMATYKNRLAGVTSDGGFVVWELPETITDDVPGRIMLCVQPPNSDGGDQETGDAPLQLAKWHPQDPDTLAVASESTLYLINLTSVSILQGQNVHQADLHHVSHVFNIPAPLVAFDFDVVHYALATISEDSTLTLWNIHDRLPYTQHKVRGEDIPSSITFVDGGVVVGRKNGTIFQLLNMTTKAVLSTIKFVNSNIGEDPEMFGHAHYDPRIGTLWIANSRRESMIAFKLNFESYTSDPSSTGNNSYVEQVVEFSGPKPTIHFVILTADADPNGDEAHAACVAAKVPPSDLALAAFSVHTGGVDQILIRKEWLESALVEAPEKLPVGQDTINQRSQPSSNPQSLGVSGPIHQRITPEDEVEADNSNRDDAVQNAGPSDRPERGREPKGKKRNVNWKGDKDNENGGNSGGKGNKGDKDTPALSEAAFVQALNREIKKTEDNLHTKIGRLLGKEIDKQNQRLEDARAAELQQDFARQEALIKVISNELTKNTTRVVENAVRTVVSQNVLPALEQITKQEVASAMNTHVGQGIANYVNQTIPHELEKLLTRHDISNHFSQVFASQVSPLIDRQVRDSVNKTFLPVYTQQSATLHQELLREIHNVKSELSTWQAEAFRSHESVIKELQLNVTTLSDQVKFLAGSSPAAQPLPAQPIGPQFLPAGPPPGPTNYGPGPSGPYPSGPPQQPQWFANTIAAPQASHPATIPQPPPPQPDLSTQQQSGQSSGRTPPYNAANPPKTELWDDVYLDTLQTQDRGKLQALLNRTNPDEVLPKNGPTAVSQAVILTLIHRLSAIVGELAPSDEEYKTSLWWLQRCISVLRPQDKIIADFIPRTIPTVHQWLNQAKQRLTILPNAPGTYDASRIIAEIQDELIRRGARAQ